MEGNKDEALRCVSIAEEAIVSGNKPRALKFIKIARRLNADLPISELLVRCESMDSDNSRPNGSEKSKNSGAESRPINGDRGFTEEHVRLIGRIRRNKDYYEVLGVEKSCSVDEIRKAYRKLSLKVHPDKNKAPGSEEAFKKVSKAFKCLSEEDSRRDYDRIGFADDFELNQQQNNRPRRRHRGSEIDPDEIFRAFFGHSNAFRSGHVYRAGPSRREDIPAHGDGANFVMIVPFLIIIAMIAYLSFSVPEYSLQRNFEYQHLRTTESHGVEFFVKTPFFDDKFPPGSRGRADIEDGVIRDHKNMLLRYCQVELQRRRWNRNIPTPHCDKLRNLGVVA